MTRDNGLYLGLARTMETLAESMRPYQEALSVIGQNAHFARRLQEPLASKFEIMDDARTRGLFNNALSESVADILTPHREILGIQSAIESLGDSFSNLIKPDMYTIIEQIGASSEPHDTMQQIMTTLAPYNQFSSLVDTTWFQNDCNWLVDKSLLNSLCLDNLEGLNSSFAQLCVLEQETSLLDGVPEMITSAASQIASIESALERGFPTNWQYKDIAAIARILDDYCDLATKQHEILHKTTQTSEKEWRLGVIEAASKYVDRQITWSLGFAETLSNEDIDWEAEEPDSTPTALPLIPTHIGYTRRQNVQKTPAEGLEDSSIVTITEKGKQITDKVIYINELRQDNDQNHIFGLSNKFARGMVNMSSIVCTTDQEFGKIVDSLYFVFYENIEHIKVFIGDGSERTGDQLVRTKEYECLFDVKMIRGDLRHDLDHGDSNKRRKKLKNVGDCYKKYCGNRPTKEKDYKLLQEGLYDEIIILLDHLIQMLRNDTEEN